MIKSKQQVCEWATWLEKGTWIKFQMVFCVDSTTWRWSAELSSFHSIIRLNANDLKHNQSIYQRLLNIAKKTCWNCFCMCVRCNLSVLCVCTKWKRVHDIWVNIHIKLETIHRDMIECMRFRFDILIFYYYFVY